MLLENPNSIMNTNTSSLAGLIWSVADLLRGDFKQSQYGRIILPSTVLRRLECVLAGSKDKVLAMVETDGHPERHVDGVPGQAGGGQADTGVDASVASAADLR